MDEPSKKRPLLGSSANGHSKVAPLTATAQRLTAILDGGPNKKRRRTTATHHHPTPAVNNRIQQVVAPPPPKASALGATTGCTSSSNNHHSNPGIRLEPTRTLQQTRGWKPVTQQPASRNRRSKKKSSSAWTTPSAPKGQSIQQSSHHQVSTTNPPVVSRQIAQTTTTSTRPNNKAGTTTNSASVHGKRDIPNNDAFTNSQKEPLATAGSIQNNSNNNTDKPRLSLQTQRRRPRDRRMTAVTTPQDTVLPPPHRVSIEPTADGDDMATTTTALESPASQSHHASTDDHHKQPPPSETPVVLAAPPTATLKQSRGGSTMEATTTRKEEPRQRKDADVASRMRGAKATTTTAKPSYRPNLVRQNLRNAHGSCRNRRASQSQQKRQSSKFRSNREGGTTIERPQGVDSQTGTDPIDDYVDGANRPSVQGKNNATTTKKGIPLCQGHQQPCCLRTVRKTGSAHRGRKFYVCALDRHEQCNHFQWADDHDDVVVTKEDTTTGFVQRQVQAYLRNLQPLTLPELRTWAKARHLDTRGKRGQVWTRIALFVRDEIARALEKDVTGDSVTRDAEEEEEEESEFIGITPSKNPPGAKEESPLQECESDSSDEELEFTETCSSRAISTKKTRVEGDDSDEEKQIVAKQTKEDAALHGELSNDESDEELEIEPKRSIKARRRESSEKDESMSVDEEDESDEELEILPKKALREKVISKQSADCPLRNRLQSLFGHRDFRPGQEWTIRRCLEGQRTLLVAPTGLGKSLCYALPAAMQPGEVVLVVSPLLSLIQDQLRELPPSLPAASLSGATPSPTLLQDLRRGRLRIFFVSPERLVSPSFRRLLSKTSWNETTRSYERIMPPVSLFCVDEAHCLSQWGHNFRPCYLRLQPTLNLIQPKSVLAITATAGPRVIDDITRTLGMPKMERGFGDDAKGIKVYKADRDNIDVTAHFVADHSERLNRLVSILSPRQDKKDETDGQEGCLARGSVIVYVWRQMDAEVIAEYIAAANVPGKVVIYHGGMDSGSRAKAQSQFLRGKARICVATVAFGLGINKSDVAGVIHMYLSNTPEHYLQEIGRAGRDGSAARAIALIVPDEVQVRHSLSHSDLLARSQVKEVFGMLRKEAKDAIEKLPEDRRNVDGLCVGLSLQSTLVGCECKPETVETVFSLLEARENSLLRVQGTFYGRAIVAPRKQSLEELASKEQVVAAILKCCQCVEPPAGQEREIGEKAVGFGGHNLVGQTYGSFCFSISQCANCLGPDAEPRHVFAALRRLQQNGLIEYVLDTTPAGRYIHMRLNRDAVDALCSDETRAYDDLIEETYTGFNLAVTTSADKVIEIYRILRRVSQVTDDETHSTHKSESLHLFQELIREYLSKDGEIHDGDNGPAAAEDTDAFSSKPTRKSLDLTVWSIVQYLQQLQKARATAEVAPMSLDHHSVADYTTLAVTKFLHGIAPVIATPSLCRQHSSFGSFQSVEFNALLSVVELIVG